MDANFWHQRWEANQIGFHQDEVNRYLQQHWGDLGVSSGTVMVPLCGKSRDMVWLRDIGHSVLGVELSPIAVADFFASLGCEPQRETEGPFVRTSDNDISILCGDFFDLQPQHVQKVSAIYDRAALIALPEKSRIQYVRHLDSIFADPVPWLLVTLEYSDHPTMGPPFSVDDNEVRRLFANQYGIELLLEMDVLDENPKFCERGLQHLIERVYRLDRC